MVVGCVCFWSQCFFFFFFLCREGPLTETFTHWMAFESFLFSSKNFALYIFAVVEFYSEVNIKAQKCPVKPTMKRNKEFR